MTQYRSATRNAWPIKCPRNRPRGTTCDAVLVLVRAARLRIIRAKPKRDKAHG